MAQRIRVKPKQSLGQNFLIDENIARNIVRDLAPGPEDVVVEIGPGNGALTRYLEQRVRRLIAVEIDGRVVGDLREKFPDVEIVHGDFLAASLAAWHERFGRPVRIVGNIPYHLTSEILFKVFDEHDHVADATMMMQKEVARRIVALPGTKAYGILSVAARFYGRPELLFDVSPNCFYPKPKVTSTVLRMTMHHPLPYTVDEALFRTVIRTAFGKRRKTMLNSLQYLPYPEAVLARLGRLESIDATKRAEQLAVDDFVRLSTELAQMMA
jgi:16S rRNA (adenine1518-N6/adenine1519-N6)-dimethyltransferase